MKRHKCCRLGRPLRSSAALFLGLVLLAVAASATAAADNIPCIWTGIHKIIAIGDLHGDYENFVAILRGTGLVDADLHWAGGTTHLVQTGDVLDRGPRARDIFDLLMRLEGEAAAAGGMVHVLLGNHEEMNIAGIATDYPNYVSIDQLVSFLPDSYRQAREREFLSSLPPSERDRLSQVGLDLSTNQALRDFWQNLLRRGRANRAYAEGFNEKYGKWLIQKNGVIRIDDIVFAHGGVSEKYSTWKIPEFNAALRRELEFFQGFGRHPQRMARSFQPRIVYDPESPLWFRGLASKDEDSSMDEVGRILRNLDARFMVVGHNYFRYGGGSPVVARLSDISRYHGTIFIIDTGISHFYGGALTALIINDDVFSLWEPTPVEGAEEVAEPTPADRMAALKNAEQFLETATVAGIRKTALPGRTEPWRVTLEDDGVTRRAVFKYIDRRRPELLPDSYHYEIAAYELAKLLGLRFVPPAVEREVEGRPGSLSLFIENTIPESERKAQNLQPGDPKALAKSMADLKIFLLLVNEALDNDKDILIRRDNGAVYRVDFSQAFAPNGKDQPGISIEHCSRGLYKALRDWDESRVAAELSSCLNEDELRDLNVRRAWIVQKLEQAIKTWGEGAVLF